MTREEALKVWLPIVVMGVSDGRMPEVKEAVEMAVKALEQEPVLDKIRSEIEQEYNRLRATRADETLEQGECLGLKKSLKIIDKYKAESEGCRNDT